MTQLRRYVPPELVELFNTEKNLQVADLYTLTLPSYGELRWTGSDAPVVLGASAWLLGPGLRREFLEFRMGVDTQMAEIMVSGTQADQVNGQVLLPYILRGGFDGAKIEIRQAYAAANGPWVGSLERFTGNVSGIETADRGEVKVSVASIMELLSRPLPPSVFQPSCKNSLFDATCAVSRAAFRVDGVATGPSSGGRLVIPHAVAKPVGWCDLGVIVFNTGANAGVRRMVRQHTSGTFVLMQPLPGPVVAGDEFTAWAGCNLTRATCISKFGNLGRFRGEPFVPPPETVI